MGSHNVRTHWMHPVCVLRIGLKMVCRTETCCKLCIKDYIYIYVVFDWINYFIILCKHSGMDPIKTSGSITKQRNKSPAH